jgi:glycosyltransferase involved in cell wall biosynthesis
VSDVDASLVVPSYRGTAHLPVLFEALRRQDFDGTWEAVIVLDGVVDDSPEIIERFDDLPLRMVAFEENRGRSAALNAGFAAARGRVLIRCDDDLEPHPTYLQDHVAAHAGPEPVGAIGIYRNVFPPTPYSKSYGIRYDEVFRNDAYAAPASGRWRYWAGNCSVPRATFDRVGGYDENFRSYGWEDVDWGYRLHQSGADIRILPELETRHHAANTSTEIRVSRAFMSGGAHYRFDQKHGIEPERPTGGGLRAKVWNAAVGVLAHNGSMARYERCTKVADRLMGAVPLRVDVKVVAVLVEAAAIAGYRAEAERGVRHAPAERAVAG